MTNEPIQEDSLQHEKRRADTWIEWAKFAREASIALGIAVLVFCLINFGVPMMKASKESSEATKDGLNKFNRFIDEAGPELLAAAKNVNATTGGFAEAGNNLKQGSEDFKLLLAALANDKHGTPALVRELISLLAEYRTQGGALMANGAQLVKNSDSRLNGEDGLFVALTGVLKKFDSLVTHADTVVEGLARQAPQLLTDLHDLLGSPEWKEAKQEMVKLLKNSVSLTANADLTMARVAITADSIAKASVFIPGIAEILQKIAKTNSRFQKAFLLARIFGLLAAGLGSIGY